MLELDSHNSIRCGDDMTVREAAVAVLRLYESVIRPADPLELAACTISAQLLKKAKSMPAVSGLEVPNWHGTTLPLDSLSWRENGRIYFEQSDIQQIADMGFNYVRLACNYIELASEQPDGLYWDVAMLKNIDNVIGWCIDLGIHVCIDMHSLPGSSTYVDVTTNATHYQQSVDIW